jgi:hypothetical protein
LGCGQAPGSTCSASLARDKADNGPFQAWATSGSLKAYQCSTPDFAPYP